MRALRAGLIEYDQRHGYRGPAGRVTLPAGAREQEYSQALEEYSPRGGLVPALILSVDEKSAVAFTRANGRISLRVASDQLGACAAAGRQHRTAAAARRRRARAERRRVRRAGSVGQLAHGAGAGRAGRAGRGRSEGRCDRCAHRRLRLLREQLQPRGAGETSAGLRVQAVPVFRRARAGLHAGDAGQRCAAGDRRSDARRQLAAAERDARIPRADAAARSAGPLAQPGIDPRDEHARPGVRDAVHRALRIPEGQPAAQSVARARHGLGVAAGDGQRLCDFRQRRFSRGAVLPRSHRQPRRQDALRGAAALRVPGLRAAADSGGNRRAAERERRRRSADPRAEQRRDALGRADVSAGRPAGAAGDLAAERLPDDGHDERRHPPRHRHARDWC